MASQDDILRMSATVVDGFSGPLKQMVQQLKSFGDYEKVIHKEGSKFTVQHKNAFEDLRKSIKTTSEHVKDIMTPAMVGLGLSAITTAGAVAGITKAMISFAGTSRQLDDLHRITGVAINDLRVLEAFTERTGGTAAEAAASIEKFSNQFYQLQQHSRGDFVTKGRGLAALIPGGEGARFLNVLKTAKDSTDAIYKSIDELDKLTPQTKRLFLEQLDLPPEWANKTKDELEDVKKHVGLLSPAQIAAGLRGKEAFDRIRESAGLLKDELGAGLEPTLTKITDAVRRFVEGPGKEWIDWGTALINDHPTWVKAIGAISAGFVGLAAVGGILAISIAGINLALSPEIIAFGMLASAVTLAYEAYKHLDEIKDRVSGKLRESILGKEGAQGAIQQEDWIAQQQKRFGQNPADEENQSGASGQTGLKKFARGGIIVGESGPEAIIPLGGGRDLATEATAKLILFCQLRIEEIWKIFTGAGKGQGFGVGGSGAGGPGGASPGGPGAPATPGAPGSPATPAGPATPATGKLADNQKAAYAAAIKEGYSPAAAKALVANLSGESLRDPSNTNMHGGHYAAGIAQWDRPRSDAIKAQFGKSPEQMTVAEQVRALKWEIDNTSRFAKTKAALAGGGTSESMVDTLVRNFEVPQKPDQDVGKRLGMLHGLGDLGGGGGAAPPQQAGAPGAPGKGGDAPSYAEVMVNHAPPDSDLKAYMAGQNVGNAPWCAAFVNASLEHAGMKGTGSNLAKSFLGWGKHVEAKDVQRGDVAVMNRGGGSPTPGGSGHVGLVTGPMAGGRVPTVEGNKGHKVVDTTEGPGIEYRRYTGAVGRGTPVTPGQGGGGGGTPADQGGGGPGGGGGACSCGGAVQAAATGLGSKGILGALFGASGAGSIVGGMLGGVKGGARAGGLLGGLLGAMGGQGGFGGLAAAAVPAISGLDQGARQHAAMSHTITGRAGVDIKFANLPKGTNVAANRPEGIFNEVKLVRGKQNYERGLG